MCVCVEAEAAWFYICHIHFVWKSIAIITNTSPPKRNVALHCSVSKNLRLPIGRCLYWGQFGDCLNGFFNCHGFGFPCSGHLSTGNRSPLPHNAPKIGKCSGILLLVIAFSCEWFNQSLCCCLIHKHYRNCTLTDPVRKDQLIILLLFYGCIVGFHNLLLLLHNISFLGSSCAVVPPLPHLFQHHLPLAVAKITHGSSHHHALLLVLKGSTVVSLKPCQHWGSIHPGLWWVSQMLQLLVEPDSRLQFFQV